MTEPLAPLLDAVRKACLPGPWSQGVKLAREGAVFGRADKKDSISVRVRSPSQTVAPSVTLYPDDKEWTCDCDSPTDPCVHVAAAVIALTQAKEQNRELPQAEAGGRIRYRLRRNQGALALDRFIVRSDATQEVLRGPLLGPHGRPAPAFAGLALTHEDLTIDRLLGARGQGYFPVDKMAEIFGALAGAADVRLEDRPIKVSREAKKPVATVIDQADGVALVIDRDPSITEVVVGGVGLAGATVHPLAETEISGPRLERLPLRRTFARGELGRLVTEVLPELQKKMPVEVKSRRLPRAQGGIRPRIHFDLDTREHTLSVTASLVYGDPPEARVEDGKLVQISRRAPVRDEAAEREELARLRDDLHLAPGRRVDFDGAEAARFAQRLAAFCKDDGGGRPALFERGRLVPKIQVDGDLFSIAFEFEEEGGEGGREAGDDRGSTSGSTSKRADAAAVLRAYADGLPLVPLEGGGFAPLPVDWLSRYGERVADLLAARQADGTIARAAIPALAELCDALDYPRPPSFERLTPLVRGFEVIPAASLPEDLRADLRPYQRRGIDWLSFLRDAGLGAVLADDMGLGKTLQAIAAVRGRCLVVCPRSVVHNWAAEISRFRPGLRYSIYHGPKRALDPSADVTLTTYALLRLDMELLAKERWDAVVLDEAQAIKTPDSQVARAAYELSAKFRLALSGTPVENRLEELWSLFHFTNRGLLGGLRDFSARYSRPIAEGEPGAAERLRRKIKPFVLRRMKGEVAPELPPRVDSVLYCDFEEEERRVYDAVRAATRNEVLAKLAEGGSVLAALEALLRLRQASCHSALVPGQSAATSSKVERLVESLEDAAADGHKALVFSQWTSFLDLIEPHLREAGVAFTRLDGSTRDRAGVVAEFQDANGPPVMLVSLKAGGTGLNLTAADHVFLMDPWWNPAVEDQAADRAHRIGQDKPVMVYRLVTKDTVEERILLLQERKRSLAGAALGEADRALSLTREDLMDLLA
jgi:superfamily II DNA or RNA helicase